MKFKYITIEREYGSGGTTIGRRLAEECGISCYGREILEETSRKIGVTIEQLEQYEEGVSNSLLYTTYTLAQVQNGNADMLAHDGHLFVAEQGVIKELAHHGKAVFLGHCASEALKDKEGVAKVYIYCSDNGIKEKRIAEEYGIPKSEIASTRRKYDNKRAKYYFANTARKWNDLKNYDIVFDTAAVGMEGCVQMLKGLIE